MAKRKLKKKVKRKLILLIILIIGIFVGIKSYKTYKYHQTYEYKLLQINYTKEEAKLLTDNLNSSQIDNLLNEKKNTTLLNILQEKYYLKKNLERYLDYYNKNTNLSTSEIVSLVNVNRDRDYYENIEETDTSKGFGFLVNKYHALNESYEVSDLTTISKTYSYGDNQKLNKEAYEAFKNLADAAKEEGHTILIVSSYRSHKRQDEVWKDYKASFGIKKADNYAARAGSSEHETGIAIDVADYNDKNDKFGETESYKWMLENSYKYGYILRYPENKENITGYAYEAWHYRYLGVDLATKVHNEGITFDEYYEYYLNK